MEKWIRICVLLAVVAVAVWSPPVRAEHASQAVTSAGAAMTNVNDLETLTKLNDDYIQSVQNSDVRRFNEILAEDFLCTMADGSLLDRKAFLAQTAQPVTIRNLQAYDVNVRLMGDFAIIHAATSYTAVDGSTSGGRYTDVWARRNGQWKAVSAHVTRR
jgi:ketosteroid isomerase-like protein